MTAAHLGAGAAHKEEQVARLLRVGRHAAGHIRDHADRRDQQRRGNGDGLAAVRAELVVERVLAADERRAVRQGCLLYTSPSPRDGLLSRMPSSA